MLNNDWKKDVLTIPNFLSLSRLLLIPLYICIYLRARQPREYMLAAAILALSCLTDFLDGWIARKYRMVSTLGKILDPAADKATQFSLTVCLTLRYPVLKPVLILFLLKESFQITAAVLALHQRKMLPGALPAGKICTAVLFTSLILLVMDPTLPAPVIRFTAGLDFCFLLFAFIRYYQAYYGEHAAVQDFPPE